MIEVHLERDMHELNFGYNTKMEGYTNLISDILKLSSIFKNPKKLEGKEELIAQFYLKL
jgi:hypothetical protein